MAVGTPTVPCEPCCRRVAAATLEIPSSSVMCLFVSWIRDPHRSQKSSPALWELDTTWARCGLDGQRRSFRFNASSSHSSEIESSPTISSSRIIKSRFLGCRGVVSVILRRGRSFSRLLRAALLVVVTELHLSLAGQPHGGGLGHLRLGRVACGRPREGVVKG